MPDESSLPTPSSQINQPLIEIFDDFLPAEMFQTTCAIGRAPCWHFGHESITNDAVPFWATALDGDPLFDAVWGEARTRCEAIAGHPLRVIRQYATGHTYGLGGKPHTDDPRPGCFTLLYYAMPEWKQAWEGETLFYDSEGEVMLAVAPRPNRAVLFDSRLLHSGRAPGRACPVLRVAVAFKLEPLTLTGPEPSTPIADEEPGNMHEFSRDGAQRVYGTQISARRISDLVTERLLETGKTLRIPGFRPGKIPLPVLEKRYGTAARDAVIASFAVEAAEQLRRAGSLTAKTEGTFQPGTGDLILRLHVTHLPDLPDPTLDSTSLTRLTSSDTAIASRLDASFHRQVLDQLNSIYDFELAPALIERELTVIGTAATPQLKLLSPEDRKSAVDELRMIAERRVRLGSVVLELARRFGTEKADASVIAFLTAKAGILVRPATEEEIGALDD